MSIFLHLALCLLWLTSHWFRLLQLGMTWRREMLEGLRQMCGPEFIIILVHSHPLSSIIMHCPFFISRVSGGLDTCSTCMSLDCLAAQSSTRSGVCFAFSVFSNSLLNFPGSYTSGTSKTPTRMLSDITRRILRYCRIKHWSSKSMKEPFTMTLAPLTHVGWNCTASSNKMFGELLFLWSPKRCIWFISIQREHPKSSVPASLPSNTESYN